MGGAAAQGVFGSPGHFRFAIPSEISDPSQADMRICGVFVSPCQLGEARFRSVFVSPVRLRLAKKL
jgi:hypothetical protein